MQQLELQPGESKADMLVRAGMITIEQAEEWQTSGREADELELERMYDLMLSYMRHSRTMGLRALFLGADQAEVDAAMDDSNPWTLEVVLRRATTARKRERRRERQDTVAA